MARRCRVLIADDDKVVATGLQAQLESLGYEVVAVVDDGEAAVETCRRLNPDLVILDIEMPALDGLAAAHQITRDPGTPVLILSAHTHPNLIEQAVQEGVIQYLIKPVTKESLHAAIQTAMGQLEEVRALRENVADLENTLRERKLIERAKGILMTRRGLSEPDAFRLLQRQSQDRRISMAKLAEIIVQADDLLERPQGSAPASAAPIPRAAELRAVRSDTRVERATGGVERYQPNES